MLQTFHPHQVNPVMQPRPRTPLRVQPARRYVVVLYPGAVNERAIAEFTNYVQACHLAVEFQNEGAHCDVMRVGLDGALTTEF